MNLFQKRLSAAGVFICLLMPISAHAVDIAPRITDREIIEGLTDLKGRSEHLEIKMDERFDAVNQRFDGVNKRFESLESTMDKRFDAVSQRFESLESTMDKRFEAVNQRFNGVNERFESLESTMDKRFDAVNQRFESLEFTMDKRFEAVNQRFESLEFTMDKRFEAIEMQFGRIWGLMLVIIAGIFGLIGFIVWDRRTVLKPVEQRLMRMESYLEHDLKIKHEDGSRMTRLIKVLREMAREDERLAAVLRSFSLME